MDHVTSFAAKRYEGPTRPSIGLVKHNNFSLNLRPLFGNKPKMKDAKIFDYLQKIWSNQN